MVSTPMTLKVERRVFEGAMMEGKGVGIQWEGR